jgi:hypothetical protein
MFNFNGVSSAVLVDSAGRPREIRIAGQRLTVTDLETVREETAAYPHGTGPRRVFIVGAGRRRYRLVHLLRGRRWTVEELVAIRPAWAEAA